MRQTTNSIVIFNFINRNSHFSYVIISDGIKVRKFNEISQILYEVVHEKYMQNFYGWSGRWFTSIYTKCRRNHKIVAIALKLLEIICSMLSVFSALSCSLCIWHNLWFTKYVLLISCKKIHSGIWNYYGTFYDLPDHILRTVFTLRSSLRTH